MAVAADSQTPRSGSRPSKAFLHGLSPARRRPAPQNDRMRPLAPALQSWHTQARAVLLSMLLLGNAMAFAQTNAATAEALMRKSGLWGQLEHVAPQVRSGLVDALSRKGSGMEPAELARLARSVDAAYGAARLRASARAVIARDTRRGDVPALLAWFGSPVGIAITRQEEIASADERSPEELVAEGLELFGSLPEARQAMIHELVDVTRSAESLTSMTINTTLAIQAGVAGASPDSDTGPGAAELRQVLEARREQMNRAFATVALAAAALTYTEVNDADLTRYLTFLKSRAGSHFTDVSMRALDAALQRAAGELGRAIPAAKDGANT